MIIRGNTVGTTMPRADYAETNPKSAAFIKNKPDEAIRKAQSTADSAVTAAGNAQVAADNAQVTANDALEMAGAAYSHADEMFPKTGGYMSGQIVMGTEPTEMEHVATKKYVDFTGMRGSLILLPELWEGDAPPYTQRVNYESGNSFYIGTPDYGYIKRTDRFLFTPSYPDGLEASIAQHEEWAKVSEAYTEDGAIVFRCFEEKPNTTIYLTAEVRL